MRGNAKLTSVKIFYTIIAVARDWPAFAPVKMGVKTMRMSLLAGSAAVLLLSVTQASATGLFWWPNWPHPTYNCSNGSHGCSAPPIELFKDNFNRTTSNDTVGNNWTGYEAKSSYVQVTNNQLQLAAKDPKGGPANWSWAIHTLSVPDCCEEGTTGKITFSFDFKAFNTDTDDFLYVTWQGGNPGSGDGTLNNLLQKYTLGGSTNGNTIHGEFEIDVDPNTFPNTIAIAFAIEIGGCGSRSCTKGTLEGVYLDNVKLVLDCLPTSEVPLPASLPMFVSGLGALGLFGWQRKRKKKSDEAAA